MSRKKVTLETGEMYHVYNRGVDKRTVFQDAEDYLRFYKSLDYFNSVEPVTSYFEANRKRKSGNRHHQERLVDIHAYCLLPNHFHILLTQKADSGVSEFMRRVGGGYTSYFNEKNSREGTLFQGVYKRAHVDSDTKLLHLAAYVNLNYTVHGFRNIHEVYKTSHVVYEGKKDCDFLETSMILDQFEGRSGYIKNAPRHCRYIFEQRAAEKNPNPNADLLE